ncbi:hypothetical protein STRIP9103_01759, partial [Streptomyces ipomoeae 91-03]
MGRAGRGCLRHPVLGL